MYKMQRIQVLSYQSLNLNYLDTGLRKFVIDNFSGSSEREEYIDGYGFSSIGPLDHVINSYEAKII